MLCRIKKVKRDWGINDVVNWVPVVKGKYKGKDAKVVRKDKTTEYCNINENGCPDVSLQVGDTLYYYYNRETKEG